MEKKTIGIAITGSFCTFDKMTGVIKTLTASGMRVIPIFSENVQHMDTRFGKAEDFRKKICEITGEQVIDTIAKAEPIGPKSSLDAGDCTLHRKYDCQARSGHYRYARVNGGKSTSAQ